MRSLMIFAAAAVFCLDAAPNGPALGAQLLEAVARGDTKAMRAALDAGADPNIKDADGTPAVMEAAVLGDASTVKLLLQRGADPNAKSAAGATALLWAAGDFEKVKLLVDQGADVNVRSQVGNTPLLVASSVDGNYESVRLLITKGADVRARNTTNFPLAIPVGAPKGSVLHNAAQLSDSRTLKLLLDAGAEVDARDQIGSTPLMMAAVSSHLENVKLLVSHGADVNAALGPGISVLSMASMRQNALIVRFLIEHGANVNAADQSGTTPLHWAAGSEYKHPEITRLLLRAGAKMEQKNALGDTPASRAGQRGTSEITAQLEPLPASRELMPLEQSILSAVAMLQKSGPQFTKVSGCPSCHNQSLPAMAVAVVREHGLKVDEDIAQQQLKAVVAFMKPMRDLMFESSGIVPDVPMTVPYVLIGMHAENYSSDALTASMVHDLASHQQLDGRWIGWAPRPPLEDGDLVATALSIRALKLYAPEGRRVEFEKRIARGREWLRGTVAITNDEKVFRLLGLYWGGASGSEVGAAGLELMAGQRAAGGWGQLSSLTSDAYATGQALVALHEAGIVDVRNPVYQRGVKYLRETQLGDGSWLVHTRAFPFQPYKESGFPHGKDQWISAAGTSWAVMALALSVS